MDVDISSFNFACIGEVAEGDEATLETKWFHSLNRIENFLVSKKNEFGYIDKIYLTRNDDLIKGKCNTKYERKFVESRFENRCLEGRLISLEEANVKSLLTHFDGHHDHLHIRFNKPNELGFITYLPMDNVDFDVDDYKLDSLNFKFLDGKLKVFPRDDDFSGKVTLWRLQDGEGFLNPNAHIDYGRWVNKKVMHNNETAPSLNGSDFYWLYVTIGDVNTGRCVQHTARVNVSDEKLILNRVEE